MLRAIKKTRIHEEVFSQIHELIKEGRFKARDQLPSERELAETFKVSRTSVREALRTLESQGLIVSRTGMGNFVVDLPVEALVGPLARMLIDEKTALADVFELRKLIEPHIAALAAERATERDIAQLKKIVAKQKEAVSRGETGVDADAELHLCISRATQNQALQKLVSGLMEMLSRTWKSRCRPLSGERHPSILTVKSLPPLKNMIGSRRATKCNAISSRSKPAS